MTMTKTITDYARRPRQAAEADGLNDILSGITFIAISGMWYANSRLVAAIQGASFAQSQDFRRELVLFILATLAMFAVIIGTKRHIQTLRERFVYSRLGYVSQTATPALRQKKIVLILSLLFTVFIARMGKNMTEAGQIPVFFNSGILPALLGGLGGAVYLNQFFRLGFRRHLVMGTSIVLSACVLTLIKLDDVLAIRCLTIFWGVCSIVAGAVTFSQLLRTPAITEGAEGAEGVEGEDETE